MVKNVTVKWGPSEHRFGRRFDHGLVSVIWHWRTRKTAGFETADFSVMDNRLWRRFDESLRIKMQTQTRVKSEATSVTYPDKCGRKGKENSTITTSNGGNERQPNHARASEPEKPHESPVTTIKEHGMPSNKISTSPKYKQRMKSHCPDKRGRTAQINPGNVVALTSAHDRAPESEKLHATPATTIKKRGIPSNKTSTSPKYKQRTPSHCPDKRGRTAQINPGNVVAPTSAHARAPEQEKLHATPTTMIKERGIPSNKTSTSPKYKQRTCPDKRGRTAQINPGNVRGRTHKRACQSTRTGETHKRWQRVLKASGKYP